MTPGLLIVFFFAIVGLLGYLLLREKRLSRQKDVKESAYIQGLSALIDGDDLAAQDLLKDAVREDSENIDAYIRLGDLYRRNRKAQHAYQVHRGLLVRTGLPRRVQARVQQSLAEDLLALGKTDRVREVLADLAKGPGESVQRGRLLTLAERAGDWEKAYEMRREISREQKSGAPANHRLALYRTWTACRIKAAESARDVGDMFRDAIKSHPSCVAAHLALGDTHYLAKQLDEAISHWRRIVDESPLLAFLTFERLERAFYDRGTLGRGTVGDLEEIYDRLLRDHPDDTTTLEAVGNLHHKRGELDEAISVCQKALEISPKSRAVRRRLVLYLHEAGRVRESERELDQLLQILANGEVDAVARALECAALRPLWECSDFDDWNLFVAAFASKENVSAPARR